MDRRYEARLAEMLSQAQVSPDLVDGLLNRLDVFMAPLAATLTEPEQRRHAAEYVTGLLSKLAGGVAASDLVLGGVAASDLVLGLGQLHGYGMVKPIQGRGRRNR